MLGPQKKEFVADVLPANKLFKASSLTFCRQISFSKLPKHAKGLPHAMWPKWAKDELLELLPKTQTVQALMPVEQTSVLVFIQETGKQQYLMYKVGKETTIYTSRNRRKESRSVTTCRVKRSSGQIAGADAFLAITDEIAKWCSSDAAALDPYYVIFETIAPFLNQVLANYPGQAVAAPNLPPGVHGSNWAFPFANQVEARHFVGYMQGRLPGHALWIIHLQAQIIRY